MEQIVAPSSETPMPTIDQSIPFKPTLEIAGRTYVFKYADLLPRKGHDEFEKFCKSIWEAGQWYPIIVTRTSRIVIDGNYRGFACAALGIEPKEQVVDDMPEEFEQWLCIELNATRRMLESVDIQKLRRNHQRQLVHKLYNNGEGYTIRAIAEKLGIVISAAHKRLEEAEEMIESGELSELDQTPEEVDELTRLANRFTSPGERKPASKPKSKKEEEPETESKRTNRGRKRVAPTPEGPKVKLLSGEQVSGEVADTAAANMDWTKSSLSTIADLMTSCEQAFTEFATHFPNPAKVLKNLREVAAMIADSALHSICPECKMECRKPNGKLCNYCSSLGLVPKSKA